MSGGGPLSTYEGQDADALTLTLTITPAPNLFPIINPDLRPYPRFLNPSTDDLTCGTGCLVSMRERTPMPKAADLPLPLLACASTC